MDEWDRLHHQEELIQVIEGEARDRLLDFDEGVREGYESVIDSLMDLWNKFKYTGDIEGVNKQAQLRAFLSMLERVRDFAIQDEMRIEDFARLFLECLQSIPVEAQYLSGFIFHMGIQPRGSRLFIDSVTRQLPSIVRSPEGLRVDWRAFRPVLDVERVLVENIDQVPSQGPLTHWSKLAELFFLNARKRDILELQLAVLPFASRLKTTGDIDRITYELS